MILRCATGNPGKLKEFQAAASERIRIEPIQGLSEIAAPEETGHTFEENAAQKALYYSGFTPDYVFVDDSGLSVDALAGEPGVYSARYAGPNATDEENNNLVLKRMRGVQDRTARFVCVIALARGGELVRTFRAEVKGRLLDAPKGNNGFGYDPLFYYEPFGCTFAEVDRERKQSVSHRGQALRTMLAYLERQL